MIFSCIRSLTKALELNHFQIQNWHLILEPYLSHWRIYLILLLQLELALFDGKLSNFFDML